MLIADRISNSRDLTTRAPSSSLLRVGSSYIIHSLSSLHSLPSTQAAPASVQSEETKVKQPRGRPPKKAVSNSTGEASSSASTSKPQPKASKAKAKKAVKPKDEDDDDEDVFEDFDVDTWVMGGYSESKTRKINKAMSESEQDF